MIHRFFTKRLFLSSIQEYIANEVYPNASISTRQYSNLIEMGEKHKIVFNFDIEFK